MYLIFLEIVLTHNLHIERLLASLLYSTPFLLCSTTSLSQVFIGLPFFLVPFTLRSNAILEKFFISFFFTYQLHYYLLPANLLFH